MPSQIENYGFIGDMYGAALVSRDGSIDWLCMPRFDSDACMAALLGRDEHGCWLIHPGAEVRRNSRRYRPGTMILETDFECDGGAVRITDFMPIGLYAQSVIRIVEGLEGAVPVYVWLAVRFGYGRSKPWIEKTDGGIRLTVAPESLILRTPSAVECTEHNVRGQFTVKKGERVPFVLSWQAAHLPPADPLDPISALAETERWWKEWSGRSRYRGAYKEVVDRSLIVLKAMSYAPTGGIIAAPTTSLPEEVGGVRNWDYRFCWLRDATLTLRALMAGGYIDEAMAWRAWLLRAVAGAPEETQIMYGVAGERRLTEFEAEWLPGYEESRPVRIGNAASDQFQLDVYGEIIEAMYEARRMGMPEGSGRAQLRQLMEFLSTAWQRPDDGIWEVRGGRQHFVYSKLMAWVAVDRYVRYIEEFLKPEDEFHAMLPTIRALRDRIRRDILEHGFNPKLNAFTQAYNSDALDATALLIPEIGFLPASDPRVQGTIRAVERELLRDGFVLRYRTDNTKDGLPGSEGAFLACSFWLVDAYVYSNRRSEAEALFERLLSLRNDLGLLSEEFEPRTGRLIGNFPQAFSHLALIQSARVLGME
ncbi:MAG: glycoside hydrolase family 15 protein [Candidatus Manganitrophaceae bacterium]|nr:MAG: glycoside hydrolase family 15 protein [Candidatus Manganitrophaceae bacterium]